MTSIGDTTLDRYRVKLGERKTYRGDVPLRAGGQHKLFILVFVSLRKIQDFPIIAGSSVYLDH